MARDFSLNLPVISSLFLKRVWISYRSNGV